MKKFIIIFSVLAFAFTACQKEEADVGPVSESEFYKQFEINECFSTRIIAGGGSYDDDCNGLWVGYIYIEDIPDDNTVKVLYSIDETTAFQTICKRL